MDWDPRLDSLGVKYNPNPAATWILTSAVYQDEEQARGRHHILFTVKDENGRPAQNAACFMDWVNRDRDDPPTKALTDSGGQANTPMYANLDTTLRNGAYFAYVESQGTSDTVSGMGLPEHHNVNFVLTFTKKGALTASPGSPAPATTITTPTQPSSPASTTVPPAEPAVTSPEPGSVNLNAQPTPADPRLASFPRPPNDNGRGLHFILDTRQAYVEAYAPYLARFQIKWATVYGGDESQCIRVAQYLKDNFGIFSNMRVEATGEAPKATSFWLTFAQKAVAAGLAPYIQVFNEPEDGREGFDTPEQFASLWIPRAQAVVDGGGFPGLQVLSKEFFDAVVRQVGDPIKGRMYFSLHNYGANHPPEYPYPGKTVMQDDTAVLRFIEFGQWFKDAWGWVPPMIGGEGGWLYRNQDDSTMPPVEAPNWIAWHLEMFEWFRKGILSNGDVLPDYLFSVHPWLLWASNWYSDSWVDGFDAEKKKPLLDTLKNAPPYVRQFYGGQPPAPPPPYDTGTLTAAIVGKAKSVTWMPVNNTAALWKFAKANGLQDQQTDEIEFTYNGQAYVCQVFNLGVVYCKKGDWGNVMLIRK